MAAVRREARMLRSAILLAAVVTAALFSGCVLGADQSPGCRVGHPEDCDSGWSCRDGVCMRPTTTLTPPDASVAADAAEGGDAPDSSEAEASSDAPDSSEAEASSDAPDSSEAEASGDAADELEAAAQQDAVSEFDTGDEPGDDVGSEASGDAAGDAMLD